MTGNTPGNTPTPVDQTPPAPVVDMTDPDEIEAAAARAAVTAEVSPPPVDMDPEPAPAPAPAPAATPPAPTDEDTDPEPAPVAAAPGAPQPMVPHGRFEKVRAERDALRDDALYLAGQVEALKSTAAAPAAPASPPPPPAPPVAERISAKREEIIALAAKYDAGEFQSLADYKRAEGALEDQLADLRAEARTPTSPPPAPAPAPAGVSWADQQLLEQQATELHEQHPYLDGMSKAQFHELAALARREALQQGKAYGNSTSDTARLREHAASLSDYYGPRWGVTPKAAPAAAAPVSPPPAPAAPGAPVLSPAARARRDKLALADGLPPNSTQIGGAPPATPGELTDAQLEAMSDDDIADAMERIPTLRKRVMER